MLLFILKMFKFNNIMKINNYTRLFSSNIKEIIKRRQDLMSPTYGTFQTFKDPVIIQKASGQYCYGPNNEKYLDLLAHNLTISVGHSHPKVKKAAIEQITFQSIPKLWFS